MFEHFSEHAKHVLDLEGMEAQRLHHTYLGTEHLLLALIDEREGHGHRVLESLGLTRRQVRQALAQLVAEGPQHQGSEYFPQTAPVRHVMKMALEEARQLKSSQIGTEHLLLALLDEPQGVAMKVLESLGIKTDDVRARVMVMLEEERAAQRITA